MTRVQQLLEGTLEVRKLPESLLLLCEQFLFEIALLHHQRRISVDGAKAMRRSLCQAAIASLIASGLLAQDPVPVSSIDTLVARIVHDDRKPLLAGEIQELGATVALRLMRDLSDMENAEQIRALQILALMHRHAELVFRDLVDQVLRSHATVLPYSGRETIAALIAACSDPELRVAREAVTALGSTGAAAAAALPALRELAEHESGDIRARAEAARGMIEKDGVRIR